MQPTIWYADWLDHPAELRQHAQPARASGKPTGVGIRRNVGHVLIALGMLLAAEQAPRPAARVSR